jgi:uncharacterized protein (DUF58 family)
MTRPPSHSIPGSGVVLRAAYHTYRAISGAKHWSKRRLTSAGLAVVLGIAIAAVMGFDTNQTMTYQLFTLLVALLLVALAGGAVFRSRFTVERSLPRVATAGTPVFYRVTVRNESRHPQSGLLLIENFTDPRPNFEEFTAHQIAEEKRAKAFRIMDRPPRRRFALAEVREQPIPVLAPRGQADVRVELLAHKRGVLRFTGASIARPDALGLFKALANVSAPQTVLILPKRYHLPPLALPGFDQYQPGGIALASSVGQSEEFVALRDYHHGDPLRRIHWKSWAKAGKPIVKEYQDEFFVRHALILDTFFEGIDEQVFEEAISVAASFACTIQTQESLLDLMFVGTEAYCFTAGRGLAQLDQMLEILAAVKPCHDQSFEVLARLVADRVHAVSGAVCVFLDWDESRRELVKRLKMLGIPLLVVVIAEAGQKTALDPGPLRDDAKAFRVLEAGKIQEGLARL